MNTWEEVHNILQGQIKKEAPLPSMQELYISTPLPQENTLKRSVNIELHDLETEEGKFDKKSKVEVINVEDDLEK